VANNGLCLDSYGATSNAGAAIDQWTCNGASNQSFQFVAGSGGYGQLQVQSSGQVVSIANGSTAQGSPDVVQEPSGAAGSQWLPQQQSDGSWQFKNQNSGLCLDVYGASSTNGQQLDQWPCKNAAGTNQDFVLS
jgi:non-reducing end alpha-L-arabinofuranosidase